MFLPPPVVAAAFGGMLGLGFVTHSTYSVQLVAFVTAAYVGSPALAVGAGLAYAAGRCVVLLLALVTASPEDVPNCYNRRPTNMRVLQIAASAMTVGLWLAAVGANAPTL